MQLTDSSIAQLYTIPAASWTAINQRVGMVLLVQNIESVIAGQIPGFPDLEKACQAWSNGTFQALIDQSVALHTYASTAIQNFTDLQNAVNALSGSTVPPEVQQQTSAALLQLANSTNPLTQAFATLSNQVSDFMKANQAVDSQLRHEQEVLGFLWQPITDITTAVDNATGLVNGAFLAINHDLKAAVSNPIDVTMPFLESLSIEVAIQAWQRIQSETAAFPSMANVQKQYWQS